MSTDLSLRSAVSHRLLILPLQVLKMDEAALLMEYMPRMDSPHRKAHESFEATSRSARHNQPPETRPIDIVDWYSAKLKYGRKGECGCLVNAYLWMNDMSSRSQWRCPKQRGR
jgi:hypothetical protein